MVHTYSKHMVFACTTYAWYIHIVKYIHETPSNGERTRSQHAACPSACACALPRT